MYIIFKNLIILFLPWIFIKKKCVQDSSLTLQVPLRYLIGALHINFKLLWEPLTKLIASHAAGLDKTVFWELYRQTLQDAAHKCGKTKIPVVRVWLWSGFFLFKLVFFKMAVLYKKQAFELEWTNFVWNKCMLLKSNYNSIFEGIISFLVRL